MNAGKQQPVPLKKNFAQFVLTWAKVFSEVISLPGHLVQSQVIKKLLYFRAKTESISKKNSQTLLHTARFEGLGEKRK